GGPRRAEGGRQVEGEHPGHPGGGGGEPLDRDGRDRAGPQRVDRLVVLEEAGVAGPVLVGQADRHREGIGHRRHASILCLLQVISVREDRTVTDVSPPLPPVTATATERAYAHTRARVLDGSYATGALITEGEVSEAVGVSR